MSQDEPALHIAMQQIIAKLIVTIAAAGGFTVNGDQSVALAVVACGLLASAWSALQGWLTRRHVFAPATVQKLTAAGIDVTDTFVHP